MPRREWPNGESVQEPNPAEDAAAKEARAAELIETGEAIDREDADEAIGEESDLVRFCERDYVAHLADLDRALDDPGTEPIDRDHICFWKAAAEVARAEGENSWELELLARSVLRDFNFGDSPNPEAQARLISAKMRLDRKVHSLAGQVGDERAQALFDQYRRRLQELINQYS